MTRLLLGPLLRHVGRCDATVWVETDAPCEVEVLGARERTWCVSGHYYALVSVTGLAAGSSTPYEVRLDGERVWPLAGESRPPSRIRTLGDDRPLRIAFGSCRYARSDAVRDDPHFEPDALECLAADVAALPGHAWPDALILLGDQVYADETTKATQARIRARRDSTTGAKEQVADFEEYTWLYAESWTQPAVRWLLSTVPSSMIFDDHDVRDDWNTSHAWREEIQRTSWWQERIIGALSSYWVYQHLGNLSPADLDADELYQRIRGHDGDAGGLLRDYAVVADREADGGKGARWSYRRDLGPVRLLMLDSRCGRILADGARSMLSEDEFGWLEAQLAGDYDHLLVGTSLPWLLPRALHDIESWNERLCAGARGARIATLSEKARQAGDLEHWAAFRASFDRLAGLLQGVASGAYAQAGVAPATVCVLSGDVHHAYVAEARFDRPVPATVVQLTCSPLHNVVPTPMKLAFRLSWSAVAERATRGLLGLVARVPPMTLSWRCTDGPYFGNELMTLRVDGRRAEVRLDRAGPRDGARPTLYRVASHILS
ncbi:MAG: alkaline phosphatase D family protein [Mycobacteriales bacterium]|nr:MAG: alkaline phosphatase [Pseudonocardiales bacterium]